MHKVIEPGMRCYINKTFERWSSNTMVRVLELTDIVRGQANTAWVLHEATNHEFAIPLSYLTIPRRYR